MRVNKGLTMEIIAMRLRIKNKNENFESQSKWMIFKVYFVNCWDLKQMRS